LLPLGGLLVAGGGFWQDQRVRQEWRQAETDYPGDTTSRRLLRTWTATRAPAPAIHAACFLGRRTARRLGRLPEAEQ